MILNFLYFLQNYSDNYNWQNYFVKTRFLFYSDTFDGVIKTKDLITRTPYLQALFIMVHEERWWEDSSAGESLSFNNQIKQMNKNHPAGEKQAGGELQCWQT